MKKISLMIAALALVLGISQCSKEDKPLQNGEKQHIVLTANNGNDGSKVSGSFNSETPAVLYLTWEKGDKISVSGGATSEQPLTLKTGENSPSATFEGDITKITDEDIVFTVGETPESFEDQLGTESGCAAWIKDNNHFVGESIYQPSGSYEVQMKLQYAVLKLDVSALGTTGAMTIAAGGGTIASVENVSSSAGKTVFVAVPANGSPKEYTISCGGKIATKTWTLEENTFYTKQGVSGPTGEAIVIEPAPQGRFTVGMDDSTPRKVEFAPGNLYYDGSVFRFEANQWSFWSTWNVNHVSLFKWSNEANAVTGTITYKEDLFCANDFTVSGDSHKWRTLTDAEWKYLLGKSNPCRDNAANLCEWKELDNKTNNGLVILPDGTENPSEVMRDIKSTSDLAAYGAVFLPATGKRDGTGVTVVGDNGIYWSSTPGGDNDAYRLNFKSASVYTSTDGRRYGYSVRLVR